MTTKKIQDVVAEILLLAQKGVRKVKDDDMTFEQFNEALRHHLTQLVKEVEAGERERFMRLIQEYSHTTEPEWIAKDLMEALSSNEDL